MPDQLAREQLDRYSDLKATRDSQFRAGWQSLANYFLPEQSAVNTQKLPGNTSSWTDRIYDTTPIQAAQVCRNGQYNWLTPSSETWFVYEPPEFLNAEDQDELRDEAAQWLAKASDITARELARSNFYGMVSIDYLQVTVFATGCMFAHEGKKTALNFHQFKAWHITIEEDEEGVVDSVHREFELTTRQAVQQFGLDKVGEKIAKAYAGTAGMSKKWKFLHACFPREDSKRLKGRMDGPNKPIASVYIAVDDQVCVQVSGYDEFPYLCSRFDRWGTDTPWGYGPAYLCQPDARQLNYVSQYRDALAELKAYPRLLYPENLEGDVDLRAGGVTTFDPSVQNGLPKEWMTVGDDRAADDNMKRKEALLNKAFYVNMFSMLEQLADKKMTAYEIAQRLGEKLEQFRPAFDRRVSEFLNPLLRRIFGLLYRQGKFGKAPASLMVSTDGGKTTQLALPEIAITSRISLALKALQNQGVINTLSVLQPLAQTHPEVLDNFDLDKLVRDLGRNYGIPPDVLRSLRDMKKIRDARAQAQAQQNAAELAQRLGGTVKDLGGAPKKIQDAVTSQFVGHPGAAAA
jgi:hypothetical protein